MRATRIGLWLVLVFLLVFGLATGCGATPTPAPAAKASGKITIYTSVPQPIIDKIQADFQGKFPDITLEVFRSGTSAVVAKLDAEKEAGEIQADLVWVAEPSTYEDLKAENLLLKFTPKEANVLPAEMKDPEGYYYAGRLINMIIGYNTGVTTKPKGWKDLLNPEYKDKLGFPTPLRSGAADASVRTLAETPGLGWEFFESFKANGGKQIKNNSTVRDQLSTGELMVGVLLDYMVRAAKAKGSPIDYVWPEEGAVFIPSPIAIFKASKNPEAAKVFVDYVLSKDGQETLVELGSFIMGLTLDLAHASTVGNPLDFLAQIDPDWVVHVHFSDSSPAVTHLPLGEGTLDIGGMLHGLGERYHGLAVIEGYVPGQGEETVAGNMAYLRRLGLEG